MDSKNILYIHGHGASGKGTLMRMLDGHPQLAVIPFHDKLMQGFPRYDLKKYKKNKLSEEIFDIEHFQRQVLAKSHYHRLQGFHHGQSLRIGQSTDGLLENGQMDFDYYKFEESWVSQQNDIDIKNVIYNILHHFFLNWNDYEYNEDMDGYFVGMGGGRSNHDSMSYLINNYQSSKIIFIERDPRGCIASIAGRNTNNKTISDLIEDGQLNIIKKKHREVNELKKKYPDRVFIIKFDDLILETNETMAKIREFLNIYDKDILYSPTLCGSEIKDYKNKYLGVIVDDYSKLLSENEKELLNYHLGNTKRPKSISIYSLYCGQLLKMNAKKAAIRAGQRILN